MKAKMQIYAEILRQLARMPDDYKEPDLGEMGGEEYESEEYEGGEEYGEKEKGKMAKEGMKDAE